MAAGTIDQIPVGRDAFLKGKAQIFVAALGTAPPANILTTDTGRLNMCEQVVTIKTGASGGTFTLAYGGDTTAGIAYDAAASAVESALDLLDSVKYEGVEVSGDAGGPYTIGFPGAIGQSGNMGILTLDETSITGGTGSGSVSRLREFCGWTEGDIKLELDETFEKHEVNDELGTVDSTPSGESGSFTATLSEATLRRVNQAFNATDYEITAAGASQVGVETLGFGGATDGGPKQVLFYALNRLGYYYLAMCHRVRLSGSGGPSFKKGGKSVQPIKGDLEVDATQDAGQKLCTLLNMTDLPTS